VDPDAIASPVMSSQFLRETQPRLLGHTLGEIDVDTVVALLSALR